MLNKETLKPGIIRCGKVYSSEIKTQLMKKLPGLNLKLIEIIEETAFDGFVDGATVTLDIIEEAIVSMNNKNNKSDE